MALTFGFCQVELSKNKIALSVNAYTVRVSLSVYAYTEKAISKSIFSANSNLHAKCYFRAQNRAPEGLNGAKEIEVENLMSGSL